MSTTFVVTLEIDGGRGFEKLGHIESGEPMTESLAAMLEVPAAKELLAAHTECSFKIRVQVRR